MELIKFNKNILFIFVGLFILSSFMVKNNPKKTIRHVNKTMIDSVKTDSVAAPVVVSDEFNRENLMLYIKELNIKYPKIVMAQAILESGHFKSKLFKNNNNMFGFRQAKKRKTTSLGTKNGYAYYSSWKDCVLDYSFYSERYLSHITSEQEYLRYLNKHYSESKNYSITLKKVMKKIKT